MTTWDERLPGALVRSLRLRGFAGPTPVQRAVLAGAGEPDMLVSAPTGSGKTVAFGLAMAQCLLGPDRRAGSPGAPRALVLAPTRELARQVAGELEWLYAGTGARVGRCVGGGDLGAELGALARGVDVVAGTPGRLRDHLGRRTLDLGRVGCAVVDEADDMLALGFREDLEAILAALPADRRLLMFSATITAAAEALAARHLRAALRVEVEAARGAGIAYQAVAVAPADRERAIVNLLRLHEPESALVFCARREGAGRLAAGIAARGFRAVPLSGALAQADRDAALAAMREGRARVCVATDLAARGLDLPGLELVIHADLPADASMLLHRSGRTGRAGRPGLAVVVVPPSERRRADALAARARVALDWVAAPGRAEVERRDLARMLADPALAAPADPAEREIAAGLMAAHAPERIAAAFGRLGRGGRPAAEDLTG
jgi:ATP-dependent RNA helicase DeaD